VRTEKKTKTLKLSSSVIIGLDPASYVTGYAIYKDSELVYGEIIFSKKDDLPIRLHFFYNELSALIEQYNPDYIVSEDQFIYKGNVTTLKTLVSFRAAALLAAAQHEIPFVLYPPCQIKRRVAGTGRAKKKDIIAAVKRLFLLGEEITDNEADALAVLYTFVLEEENFGNH